MALAIAHAHRIANHTNNGVLPEARETVVYAKVNVPPRGAQAPCAPPGVTVAPMVGDLIKGIFIAEVYVDGMDTLEACPRDHIRILGSGARNPVLVMSRKKLTDWSVHQEIVGCRLDFQSMTISIPPRKVADSRQVLV